MTKNKDILLVARPDHSIQIYRALPNSRYFLSVDESSSSPITEANALASPTFACAENNCGNHNCRNLFNFCHFQIPFVNKLNLF